MTAREAVVALEVQRRQHLARHHQAADAGRGGLERADDKVAELVAPAVPVALAQAIGRRLHEDAHDVADPGGLGAVDEERVDEAGDGGLQPGRVADAARTWRRRRPGRGAAIDGATTMRPRSRVAASSPARPSKAGSAASARLTLAVAPRSRRLSTSQPSSGPSVSGSTSCWSVARGARPETTIRAAISSPPASTTPQTRPSRSRTRSTLAAGADGDPGRASRAASAVGQRAGSATRVDGLAGRSARVAGRVGQQHRRGARHARAHRRVADAPRGHERSQRVGMPGDPRASRRPVAAGRASAREHGRSPGAGSARRGGDRRRARRDGPGSSRAAS